jgi:hypothetical protein
MDLLLLLARLFAIVAKAFLNFPRHRSRAARCAFCLLIVVTLVPVMIDLVRLVGP